MQTTQEELRKRKAMIRGCRAMAEDNMVKKPRHYDLPGLDIQVIDVIRAVTSDMPGFKAHCRGTALKYLCRAGHKEKTIQDLEKCKQYIDWEIEELKKEKQCG